MKNTKTILITGIVLEIALFASVQVIAMEQKDTPTVSEFVSIYQQGQKINPYLTINQRIGLRERIRQVNLEIEMSKSPSEVKESKKYLEDLNKIYYGNRSYT